jgi:serine/threonine protein kinase
MQPFEITPGVELVERIASGATSVVFRARATKELEYAEKGTPLAVKVLKEEPRGAVAERWKREVAIGSSCRSPNLIKYFDHGTYIAQFGAQPFVVMEWFIANTLEDLAPQILAMTTLQRRHHLRSVLSQSLQGLQYLHDRGIIHRDLQRRNILISPSGHLKIINFGTSKHTSTTAVTERWEEIGTRRYWPPEYFSYVVSPDEWSSAGDIFMLASCLIHAYSGNFVFSEAKTYPEFFDSLRRYGSDYRSRVPELDQCRSWLSRILYGVLQIMLSPRPDDRLPPRLLLKLLQHEFRRYVKRLDKNRFPLTALIWCLPSNFETLATDFIMHLVQAPPEQKIRARDLHSLKLFGHVDGKSIVSLVKTLVLFGLLRADPVESGDWYNYFLVDQDESDWIFKDEVILTATEALHTVNRSTARLEAAIMEKRMALFKMGQQHGKTDRFHTFWNLEMCSIGDEIFVTYEKRTVIDQYYLAKAAKLIDPIYLSGVDWKPGALSESRWSTDNSRID